MGARRHASTHRRAPWDRSRPRDERGATVVVVAICASLVVLIAAFVVDIGVQRVLRRDLQAIADLVALDMARELPDKTAGAYTAADRAALVSARNDSLERNADAVGGELPPDAVDWELVVRDGDVWRAAAPAEVPSGVRVTASSTVPFGFGRIAGINEGGASRSAVGSARETACLKVSSYAAQVDSGDSWLLDFLLGDLLGTSLSAKVLDPEKGLAGVDLSLLDLIEELDPLVGADISALSFTSAAGVGVGLSELMLAAVKVLERESGRTAEIDLLRNVMGGIQANLPNVDITLSDLVELDTAEDAAAELDLNLLDIVAGSLAIANGTNVIALPLNVKLPLPIGAGGASVVDLKATLKVGQRPVVQCSGVVRSSQIEIGLAGNAVNIDLGLIKVIVPLAVRITLADASASVAKATCLDDRKRLDLLVDSGLLSVDVRLGRRDGDPASSPVRVSLFDIGLPGWNGIEVLAATFALTSGQSTSRPTRSVPLEIVGDDYTVSIPASTGGLGIPTLHLAFSDFKILGGLGPLSDLLEFLGIGSLLNWTSNLLLQGLVNPLVSTLDTWLLDPLLRTLGINLAGGTVQAVPNIDCGTPQLIG